MSSGLVLALDCSKMSVRKAVFVILKMTKVSVDITDFNINCTSISRGCKSNSSHFAEKVKVYADVPLVVHRDEKLMEELTTKQHVDRLQILVTVEGMEKLTGVPKLPGGGTGEPDLSHRHSPGGMGDLRESHWDVLQYDCHQYGKAIGGLLLH